jgi:hypothetical protein
MERLSGAIRCCGRAKPMQKLTTPNIYPEVLKTFARMIDGTPKVQTFEVRHLDLP